jgi:hypothetical protein
MRIISFPSAALPSLWALPAQALAPWMSRVKHLTEQATQGDSDARVHALTSEARAASIEAVFAMPEMLVRPGNTVIKAAPLRIVRESDSALGVECAGRMVISGRMADVCAELDRMALRAAAAQDALVAHKP